jgi:hypothetical protein
MSQALPAVPSPDREIIKAEEGAVLEMAATKFGRWCEATRLPHTSPTLFPTMRTLSRVDGNRNWEWKKTGD